MFAIKKFTILKNDCEVITTEKFNEKTKQQ